MQNMKLITAPEEVRQPGQGEELLSLAEAGQMLGVSGETVRLLCHAGKIDYIRYSIRCIRIRREDLEKFRQQCYHPAKPEPPNRQLVRLGR